MSISKESHRDCDREKRFKDCLEVEIEFIANPDFERALSERGLADCFLGPMPNSDQWASYEKDAPQALPPYLMILRQVPRLTREQEVHLFRQMNFLKYKAWRAQEADLCDETLDEIERLLAKVKEIEKFIITANLPLSVSIAKKCARGREADLMLLVSDANVSLIKAVRKFDFSLGYKFSSYAARTIMNDFAGSIPKEIAYRKRFGPGVWEENQFQNHPDHRSQEHSGAAKQREDIVLSAKLLGYLSEREQEILKFRHGFDDGECQTLEQIGLRLGISKERVRLIEDRALKKLRKKMGLVPHNPASNPLLSPKGESRSRGSMNEKRHRRQRT